MTVSQQRLFSMALDYAEGLNKQKLIAAKEKLAVLEGCVDKTTAAAFGYLLAKEEEDEEPEARRDIYDQIHEIIADAVDWESCKSVETMTEDIFCHFYSWLSNQPKFLHMQKELNEAFEGYLKPGIIKDSK
jgi:hypothetical protein